MLRALDDFVIAGPTTLVGFHRALLSHRCFVRAETCAGIVESIGDTLQPFSARDGAPVSGRSVDEVRTIEVDGRRFQVRLLEPEPPWRELARRRQERASARGGGSAGRDAVVSPMQGTVLSVAVAEGDSVEVGQVLCIVEAMKMENEVHAHRSGTVTELTVAAGQPIGTGQVICVLD